MRGMSAEALARTEEKLEAVTQSTDAQQLGDGLLSVASLLRGQPSLRRALTDPAASAEAKERLARGILGGKISDEAVDVVSAAAAQRWSSSGDLVVALERAGALSLTIAAETQGDLSELEDDLFRFSRIVVGDPQLRDAISNKQVPVSRRQELVRELLEGKAGEPAVHLAVQAVASGHRSFEAALDEYQKIAADRQRRLVALVRAAIDLTEDQRTRLTEALRREYGRDIHLNVVVDPGVLGGIRVEVGDDVIDGTVAGRLDDARRRMAG